MTVKKTLLSPGENLKAHTAAPAPNRATLPKQQKNSIRKEDESKKRRKERKREKKEKKKVKKSERHRENVKAHTAAPSPKYILHKIRQKSRKKDKNT